MQKFTAHSTTSDITGTFSESSFESFRTASKFQDFIPRLPINTIEKIGRKNIGSEKIMLEGENGPSSGSVIVEDELDIKVIIRTEARDQQREAQTLVLQNR
ncbi:hypothetical protein GcC1_182033 [Golovinomyces cichoracearum]|uniref:Uncharacterized protein n=1 Tax=Golovinomyces cichoracearum TaxID=62708 RepID=A0A420HM35_9PEZI|nr:hypothetical protein GcC1_182033 [Golovinomyces cichoracearum]